MPGLTKGEGSGPYDAASDPAVAYDAKHGVWMIASLPLSSTLANASRRGEPVDRWRIHLAESGQRRSDRAEFRQELDRLRQLADQSALRQLLRGVGRSAQSGMRF